VASCQEAGTLGIGLSFFQDRPADNEKGQHSASASRVGPARN
jgi:hypothetical protein